MIRIGRTWAIVAALGVAACISTSYRPQAGRELRVIWEDGHPVYVRDGKSFNNLVDAVAVDPAARDAASTASSRSTAGAVLGILGGGCWGATGAILATTDSSSDHTTLGLVALGCLGLTTAGAIVSATAVGYTADAINLYNDHVMPALPPLPRPVAAAPAATNPEP